MLAKAKFLRVWAQTPRSVREILKEIVKKGAVKIHDLTAMVELMAELEDHYHQASLYGDQYKFDEADFLLAIVVAHLPSYEERWGKHALKKRQRGEKVTFQTLLAFLEEEAVAVEEPEGMKARVLAHELVEQLRSSKRPEKPVDRHVDRLPSKVPVKSEHVIINAAQWAQEPRPPSTPATPLRPTAAPFAMPAPTVPPASSATSVKGFEGGGGSTWSPSCAACQQAHAFYLCPQYVALPVAGRREMLAKHRVCFQCANSTRHRWRRCRQKQLRCTICGGRHHSSIHEDNDRTSDPFLDARLPHPVPQNLGPHGSPTGGGGASMPGSSGWPTQTLTALTVGISQPRGGKEEDSKGILSPPSTSISISTSRSTSNSRVVEGFSPVVTVDVCSTETQKVEPLVVLLDGGSNDLVITAEASKRIGLPTWKEMVTLGVLNHVTCEKREVGRIDLISKHTPDMKIANQRVVIEEYIPVPEWAIPRVFWRGILLSK